MSLTVAQAVADLRGKLGIFAGDTPPGGADADVIFAINWALQTMQKAGSEFFTRESIAVTLVAGQSAYPLAASTQAVLGPVKTKSGRLLRKVEHAAEVESFGQLYLGQTDQAMLNGAPQAFHVRDSRADAANSHLVTLHVMPAPDAAAVTSHSPLAVDGVKVCANYTVEQIASTDVIKVPDAYAESLFMPLARLQVTRSPLFSQAENLERIQQDAQLALRTLGLEPDEKPDGGEASQ